MSVSGSITPNGAAHDMVHPMIVNSAVRTNRGGKFRSWYEAAWVARHRRKATKFAMTHALRCYWINLMYMGQALALALMSPRTISWSWSRTTKQLTQQAPGTNSAHLRLISAIYLRFIVSFDVTAIWYGATPCSCLLFKDRVWSEMAAVEKNPSHHQVCDLNFDPSADTTTQNSLLHLRVCKLNRQH